MVERSILAEAIQNLRDHCNVEITKANNSAYRSRPNAPIIIPDVPFPEMNKLLKACDAGFAAYDEEKIDGPI